ncbi:MAG: hypothetical protein V1883_02125 [Candidatus Omnitrophota bacterium]
MVNKSFLEGMTVQFAERMPGIEVDIGKKEVFIARSRDIRAEIEDLERRCARRDLDFFSISEDYASGLYEYLYRLKDHDNAMIDYLKGQVTGPVSFGLSVTDEDKVPLFFDKELFDAAVKTLSQRARWQASRLKEIFRDIILFVDEPSLSYFKEAGRSSKINKEGLALSVGRVTSAIRREDCYAGIHCCGDADWDLVLSCGIDILSFDAYSYGESLIKSSEKISDFVLKGGIIAWGIVPSAALAGKESKDSLTGKLDSYVNLLSKKLDREKIIKASLITPSCGLGALDESTCESTIKLCVEVSEAAKKRITF